MISGEEIKSTNGIFDPSLGGVTNAVSGTAKRAEISQGEIATFNFQDNVARGIRYTWELLIDLIPRIYDTERTVRIIGTDGAEDYAKINAMGPNGESVNDLSRGKYDVTVTVGPSFSTQRQEAAEIYMGLSQANPAVMGVAGDLIFKSLDLPYAQDMAERMQAMLPPQIQQQLANKKQNSGKSQPPEVMAAMAQASQAMEQVQMHGQLVQEAAQELEQMKGEAASEKAAAEKAKADVQVQAANLKVQEADLKVQVAEFQKLVIETESRLSQETQGIRDSDKAEMTGQVQQALEQINTQSELFMQAAAQLLQQMQAITAQPVVVEKPVNRVMRFKRVQGGLEGTVVDADTGEPLRQVAVQRVGGELVGQVKEA
jgi:hypothetical protein